MGKKKAKKQMDKQFPLLSILGGTIQFAESVARQDLDPLADIKLFNVSNQNAWFVIPFTVTLLIEHRHGVRVVQVKWSGGTHEICTFRNFGNLVEAKTFFDGLTRN